MHLILDPPKYFSDLRSYVVLLHALVWFSQNLRIAASVFERYGAGGPDQMNAGAVTPNAPQQANGFLPGWML